MDTNGALQPSKSAQHTDTMAQFLAYGWTTAAAQELADIEAEQRAAAHRKATFPDTIGIQARFDRGRTLRRLQPAPTAAASGEPGQIRIAGRMSEAARVHATSGSEPHALLSVCVSTGAGPCFHATHDMGAGFDAHLAAHNKARALQKGDEVTIVCGGIAGLQPISRPTLICSRVSEVVPHRAAGAYAATRTEGPTA